MGAALAGVAIGVIDVGHDATRGRLVVAAFGVAAVAAALLSIRNARLRAWERRRLAPSAPLYAVPTSPPLPGCPDDAPYDVPLAHAPGMVAGTDSAGPPMLR